MTDHEYDTGEGWRFLREADDFVRIIAPDSAGPGAHQTIVLDGWTWAAIIETVGEPS